MDVLLVKAIQIEPKFNVMLPPLSVHCVLFLILLLDGAKVSLLSSKPGGFKNRHSHTDSFVYSNIFGPDLKFLC